MIDRETVEKAQRGHFDRQDMRPVSALEAMAPDLAADWLRLSARVAELEKERDEALAEVTRLREAWSKLFDAAQQVHRDGGRDLARLVTEGYDG